MEDLPTNPSSGVFANDFRAGAASKFSHAATQTAGLDIQNTSLKSQDESFLSQPLYLSHLFLLFLQSKELAIFRLGSHTKGKTGKKEPPPPTPTRGGGSFLLFFSCL